MNEELLKIIGIVVGAGGLGAFLTYKLGNRKQDSSEFKTVVEEYKDLVTNYKSELDKLRKDFDELKVLVFQKEDEIKTLRNQLMIFESSHADIPMPMWLKDTNGIMLFLNEEYERIVLNPIGKTTEDYIGKTDYDVWGKEIGKQFTDNDKQVMRQKKPVQFKETWQGSNGATFVGTLLKYPRFLNNRTVIGIGGVIMNIKQEKKTEK